MNEASLFLMFLLVGKEPASPPVPATAPSALPRVVASGSDATTTIQPRRGRVDSVDAAGRRLTFTDAAGKTHSLKLGAGVNNLTDFKTGDRVIVEGTTTLAVSIRRHNVVP